VARAKSLRRPRAVPESVIPKNILAKEIASILEKQQLTQTEAAYIMRDAPSQISLVVTGKLRGFSTERLARLMRDPALRRRLGQNGAARARDEFTAAAYFGRIEELYSEVLGRTRAQRPGR